MPGRIPDALKNVFLQSQTGIDVEQIAAPTDGAGFKVFNNRGLRRHVHTVVSHQKVPQPEMRAPRRSSLNHMRRGSDTMSVASNDSTPSLSSMNSSSASHATNYHIGENKTKPKKVESGSPQHYLNKELKRRGYNLKSYATLESGYYTHPNEHQLASYGRIVTKAMYQPNNTKALGLLLECGISPNACNKFGESIVHLVCRRGHYDLLTMLMDGGCSIKVSDDYGRTPLHDACWQSKPNFDVIRLIFQTDKHLVKMRDIRGTTPLSYVKEENFVKWNEFLASIMDEFWPRRNPTTDGAEPPPPLTMKRPNSINLREHNLPLTIDQISMLSSGKMTTEEAQLLAMDDDSTFDSDDSGDSYFDSDDSSFYDSDSDFDEAELEEVCMLAGNFNLKEYCVR
mmetsp:Transcript_42822/g.103561  ORF Transcript_42822/g.103561 Transcript_42822/m.103561 type:complete len:397 (+) Transcript_42822:167-1357(+)|eukprot:CAMPEP_0113631528 /NCGR_PEP_ID=MMETSP0017_2-20120614/16385_1 /TAXON_ID=2856 /ORGANISM="Cylindrotheca closterium" /LENGTH=396 /DNA_ID=CAMNT_0000542043 /DNA_START=174 /DNA_END=1364 /DNA_ORIENTATION=+ /assembly_acc=CAM_ASM_000147